MKQETRDDIIRFWRLLNESKDYDSDYLSISVEYNKDTVRRHHYTKLLKTIAEYEMGKIEDLIGVGIKDSICRNKIAEIDDFISKSTFGKLGSDAINKSEFKGSLTEELAKHEGAFITQTIAPHPFLIGDITADKIVNIKGFYEYIKGAMFVFLRENMILVGNKDVPDNLKGLLSIWHDKNDIENLIKIYRDNEKLFTCNPKKIQISCFAHTLKESGWLREFEPRGNSPKDVAIIFLSLANLEYGDHDYKGYILHDIGSKPGFADKYKLAITLKKRDNKR